MIAVQYDVYFAIVPDWLVEKGNARATQLYAALAIYADKKTLECFPSRKALAQKCGMDERTVSRAIADLKAYGAIEVTERKREDGGQSSNTYLLRRTNPKCPAPLDISVQPPLTPVSSHELELEELESRKETLSSENEVKPSPLDAEFDLFYESFPRHTGRGAAVRAFRAARKKAELAVILAGLDAAKAAWQREGRDPQFIPYPATWLNGERWLDEHTQESVLPEEW